jgi:hypothetical protein
MHACNQPMSHVASWPRQISNSCLQQFHILNEIKNKFRVTVFILACTELRTSFSDCFFSKTRRRTPNETKYYIFFLLFLFFLFCEYKRVRTLQGRRLGIGGKEETSHTGAPSLGAYISLPSSPRDAMT